jgi:predicted dienelactone hydrolase
MAEQSFDLTEFFASHGWLVAAPDHTGNTFRDLGTEMSPDLIFLRPTDVSAVLDHLENLPGDHPLAGRSGDDVVVAGHSFGGYTTLAVAGAELAGVEDALAECDAGTLPDYVCDALTEERVELAREGFLDTRVDLAIPIAPGAGVVFAEGVADIDVPVLLITGKADATTTNPSEGDPIWAALDGPDDLRVDIERAGHFSFTSVCDVFPSEFFGDGCGDDYIDRETLFTIVNAYSLAFSRHHLWGDDTVTDLLEGRETLADEVELSHGAE